jgi:hypothetical protein
MKEVVILLLLAVMLSSCNNANTVQTGVGGIWQANLTGGDGTASGLSFITQFTVNGDSSTLSFSSLQLINNEPDSCIPYSPSLSSDAGSVMLSYNSADQLINSSLTLTVTSGGNTLTLTSTSFTGTINTNTNVLTDGLVTGTWTIAGSPGCIGGGDFTMTQTVSNP